MSLAVVVGVGDEVPIDTSSGVGPGGLTPKGATHILLQQGLAGLQTYTTTPSVRRATAAQPSYQWRATAA